MASSEKDLRESLKTLQNSLEENEVLLSLSQDFAQFRHRGGSLDEARPKLKRLFGSENVFICTLNESLRCISPLLRIGDMDRSKNDGWKQLIQTDIPIDDGVLSQILFSTGHGIIELEKISKRKSVPAYVPCLLAAGIKEGMSRSIIINSKPVGQVTIWRDKVGLFTEHHEHLLQRVADQVSLMIMNLADFELVRKREEENLRVSKKITKQLEEISRYKEQLEEEKSYLQEEVSSGYSYADIIGASKSMNNVFLQLSKVAFANSTVLLLGETGTGKELVARAIHNQSPRKDKLMVKINCAAMPANLIESELFGHEKGSFTGATERRIGKFELAQDGTLFLDEIGEMPIELQVKLLRAIQEREIERIGGKATIKVNVRIIAATNRNLLKEVEEGRFRSDLFYRLNVFPITMPPLRERKEDIPRLVNSFIIKYAKSTGRRVDSISAKALKELMSYSWPGNVRELEYLVERSVLTATGTRINDIELPVHNKLVLKKVLEDEYLKTHEENERDHILRVLSICKGKIYGPGGAAEILGLRVSTLNSKMKKLGIQKKHQFGVSQSQGSAR
ncbi:sigma-54 interaction domain-containing protein [Pollutibacter soli]|uniref:sigma-54 interaction domain-containing protein n=1 Tax=Pollutibacter soli TaxID=3034157 RepID=UPI003013FC65